MSSGDVCANEFLVGLRHGHFRTLSRAYSIRQSSFYPGRAALPFMADHMVTVLRSALAPLRVSFADGSQSHGTTLRQMWRCECRGSQIRHPAHGPASCWCKCTYCEMARERACNCVATRAASCACDSACVCLCDICHGRAPIKRKRCHTQVRLCIMCLQPVLNSKIAFCGLACYEAYCTAHNQAPRTCRLCKATAVIPGLGTRCRGCQRQPGRAQQPCRNSACRNTVTRRNAFGGFCSLDCVRTDPQARECPDCPAQDKRWFAPGGQGGAQRCGRCASRTGAARRGTKRSAADAAIEEHASN